MQALRKKPYHNTGPIYVAVTGERVGDPLEDFIETCFPRDHHSFGTKTLRYGPRPGHLQKVAPATLQVEPDSVRTM